MTMTHTPGPWIAKGDKVYDSEGRIITRAAPWQEREANACLMAAAPTLLKALKDMVAASNHSAAWERARAAITLAEFKAN